MIDIKHLREKCQTPLCDTRTQKKHKGYCSRCFSYTFPEEAVSRNYKTKELLVQNFIKDKFEDCKMQFDKIIENGCSRRRPDVFIDCFTHILLCEIDEWSHDQYETICDLATRTKVLSRYLKGEREKLVSRSDIRFNPDKYINNKDESIKSCFKIDKTGKCILNDVKQWNHRLQVLQERIEYHISNIPEKSITTEYLFYNGY